MDWLLLRQLKIENALAKRHLSEGSQWIAALKSVQIQKLVQAGALQLSLFDQRDLAEIQHPSYPGERLIACLNPCWPRSGAASAKSCWRPPKNSWTKSWPPPSER